MIGNSLRTPLLDINNQEELSAVVTQENKEIHEKETEASINQIKIHLNNLAPIPIINRNSGCSTSSIEITSTQNKENVRNTKNKRNAVINKKELALKIKKKKSNWFCFICGEDREENMINCLKCKLWAHDLCAGVDKRTKKYICDVCNT